MITNDVITFSELTVLVQAFSIWQRRSQVTLAPPPAKYVPDSLVMK